MSHLEELLAEYYQWLGHFVKCNAMVGKRARGGWEMELDLVTYDPQTIMITHLEPSLDTQSWAQREQRFSKKFQAGRKYILKDMFPWLPPSTPIRQEAILVSCPEHRKTLAGVKVRSVDEVIGEIKNAVACKGLVSRAAISEHYPLLRTIQFAICGYYRLKDVKTPLE